MCKRYKRKMEMHERIFNLNSSQAPAPSIKKKKRQNFQALKINGQIRLKDREIRLCTVENQSHKIRRFSSIKIVAEK